MWPVGSEIDPEVCYCYCHRGDGGKVAHIEPCCKVCTRCQLNIKFEIFEVHEKKCKPFPEFGKKVA